jgi:glycosyltransferase involved in cell wall biosynthesis
MDISIIVPVYNVDKYLERCLDSLLSQQFSGTFEVIAVDDGSTDNSLSILKAYQEKDSRLKVIVHEENKKLSVTRTTGMRASSGDYIMHVDSDDWLLPQALENLFKKCIDTDADVLVFNFLREDNSGRQSLVQSIKKALFTTDKLKVQKHFLGASVNKIVKKNLTENMSYGALAVNYTEDLVYSSEILYKAKTICLLPENYYVYFVNPSSIIGASNLFNNVADLRTCIIACSELIDRYQPERKIIRNLIYYVKFVIVVRFITLYNHLDDHKCNFDILIDSLRCFQIYSYHIIKHLRAANNNKFGLVLELFLVKEYRLMLKTIITDFNRNTKVSD